MMTEMQEGSKRRDLKWEVVALVIVVITVLTTVNIPLVNSLLSTQDGVVVRMYVHESGGFDPDALVIKVGEKARINLMAMDITHSFVIPELGIDSGPIEPGHMQVIEFTPQRTGTFTIYCGAYCSPEHSLMKGKLVVTR